MENAPATPSTPGFTIGDAIIAVDSPFPDAGADVTVLRMEKYVYCHKGRKVCIDLSSSTEEGGSASSLSIGAVSMTVVAEEGYSAAASLLIYTDDPFWTIERPLLFKSRTRSLGSRQSTWKVETPRGAAMPTPPRRAIRLEIVNLPACAVIENIHVTVVPRDEKETKEREGSSVSEWLPVKNKHAAGGGEYCCCDGGEREGTVRFRFPAVQGRGDLRALYLLFTYPLAAEDSYVVHATGRPSFEVGASDRSVFEVGPGESMVKLNFSPAACMDVATLNHIQVVRKEMPFAAAALASVSVDFYDDFTGLLSPPPPPKLILREGRRRNMMLLCDLKGGTANGPSFYRSPDGTVVFSSAPTVAGTSLAGLFDGNGCVFSSLEEDGQPFSVVEIVIAFPRPVRIAEIEVATQSVRATEGAGTWEIRFGAGWSAEEAPFIVFSPTSVRYSLAFGPEPRETSEISLRLKERPTCRPAFPGITIYTVSSPADDE